MFAGYSENKSGRDMKYHLVFYRKNKPKGKKTNIYNVFKDMDDKPREHLGIIKWNGAFRKYWFLPDNNTGWSDDCMDLVSNFLKRVNKRYRNKLKKLKKDGKNNN